MKSKNLIAIAVASTFGWSAAALAGSGRGAISESSASEASEMIVWDDSGFDGGHASAIGSSPDFGEGTVSGSYSDSSGFMGSDEFASTSLNTDESLALEDGIYSDLYFVSFEPVSMDGWHYYLIDTSGPDELAASEEFWLMPTHELVLIPSTTDEMVYDLVLVPMTFDDMTADFGSGITNRSGE